MISALALPVSDRNPTSELSFTHPSDNTCHFWTVLAARGHTLSSLLVIPSSTTFFPLSLGPPLGDLPDSVERCSIAPKELDRTRDRNPPITMHVVIPEEPNLP
jgi:hypothetical protein